jgi:hypothetical protein
MAAKIGLRRRGGSRLAFSSTEFLLELGVSFAFVGSQYPLEMYCNGTFSSSLMSCYLCLPLSSPYATTAFPNVGTKTVPSAITGCPNFANGPRLSRAAF